jgi:deoxyribonuclease IV
MYLGAHVSASGGIEKAIGRAREIGAEAVQIFPSSPRMWRFKMTPEANIAKFQDAAKEAEMGPTVFHGIYLCALASEDEALVERSIESLTNYLTLAEAMQIEGVLFHPASHRGRGYEAVEGQFIEGVNAILDAAPGTPWLALENSAGMGDHIGSKFEELGRLIKAIGNPRIKVCLDTQHAWAAGYDVATVDGINATMDEFDREIGLDLLKAVHCNDSKTPIGSAVDRHENIGEGEIGISGFESILGHAAFAEVPFYLEVPGFEKGGPDKKNMDIIKSIRDRVTG